VYSLKKKKAFIPFTKNRACRAARCYNESKS